MVLPEMVQIPLFLRFTLIGHHFFFFAAEVQIAIIGSLELGIYHRIYYKMILNTIRREPICYIYELGGCWAFAYFVKNLTEYPCFETI